MKKIFYFFLIFTSLMFIGSINLFLKENSDLTHIIGINIIIGIYLLISLICMFITTYSFKKLNLDNSKNYRKDIKIAFANSFFKTSLFSIISACIIYGFLENILETLGLKDGIINYCTFAAKIWFISSPFIGLEIAVFQYFYSIEYLKKPVIILILKLLTFLTISFLYYESRKNNCFIYAKPVCDIIFLIYYSRICFDVTLNKA